MSNLCKKASQKLHALARISSFIGLPQRWVIMKACFNSQFGYCPLVWMIHCRSINNKINRVHERRLRIVCKDKFSSFENLLEKDKTVKIQVRNLQVLVTEMLKVKNGIAPKIISDIFKLSNPTYNLRSKRAFVSNQVETVCFSTESLSQLPPKLWALLPQDMKTLTSLTQFKSQVKNGFYKTALAESSKYTSKMLALYNSVNSSLCNLFVFHLFIYFLIS